MRHLLTHTAGLGYFFIHPEVLRYFAATGMPVPGSLASIRMPLMFDPGERWEYSVATDWVGQAIEAVTGERLGDYLRRAVLDPLGMASTAFLPTPPAGAAQVHQRSADGGFTTVRCFWAAASMTAAAADWSRPRPTMPGSCGWCCAAASWTAPAFSSPKRSPKWHATRSPRCAPGPWAAPCPSSPSPMTPSPISTPAGGWAILINPETGPNGRAPGSLAWAGIFNSYYWIDPASGVGGVLMSQLQPFGDPGALALFGALERMAYA